MSPSGETVVTSHRWIGGDARTRWDLADASCDLVVTSPPYPMVEMWDGIFSSLNPAIGEALSAGRGADAFEGMHAELDPVWREMWRVLRFGGFAAVNIGDATRSLPGSGEFRLWSNHTRVLVALERLGFSVLPDILWRKPTNAPNKFLGSGMLPAGAYVTYEHEYILIVRKGSKRIFASPESQALRARSAYFWEERNTWFSDVWTDLRGTSQVALAQAERERSGAFPFELAYRLIQMYSVQGDVVLDPFLGTGTTTLAAAGSGRNSVGIERDEGLLQGMPERMEQVVRLGNARVDARLDAHRRFVQERLANGGALAHACQAYGFPVMTRQETTLRFVRPRSVRGVGPGTFEVVGALGDPEPEQISLF